MILVIDNYDSFVNNLARYVRELGCETRVVRNDALGVSQIESLRPRGVILSPGPCGPREAGISLELVRKLGARVPMLGVCLGHQVIGEALGGRVVRAPRPTHGRASQIRHCETGLFDGLPNPLRVGRYHSLIVSRDELPADLEVTAWTDDGLVMGLEHSTWPVFGVQFHPESILTQQGHALLANFLRRTGHDVPPRDASAFRERPLLSVPDTEESGTPPATDESLLPTNPTVHW